METSSLCRIQDEAMMSLQELIFEIELYTFNIIVTENYKEIIEEVSNFNDSFLYKNIKNGEVKRFIKHLKSNREILIFNMQNIDINIIHRFFEELQVLRDKLADKHIILFITNVALKEFKKFEHLKSFSSEIFENIENEFISKEDLLKVYNEKYNMSNSEFLDKWKNGELEDSEDFNRWYVLL